MKYWITFNEINVSTISPYNGISSGLLVDGYDSIRASIHPIKALGIISWHILTTLALATN